MYKEIIICIVVITLIIVGNIITQNNTIKIVDEMKCNLEMLQEEVTKETASKEKAKQKMQKVQKTWDNHYETMAYYIEHDELEKVGTELTKLGSDIEMEEYSMATENLSNCAFILEHIKDKSALKIVNIF